MHGCGDGWALCMSNGAANVPCGVPCVHLTCFSQWWISNRSKQDDFLITSSITSQLWVILFFLSLTFQSLYLFSLVYFISFFSLSIRSTFQSPSHFFLWLTPLLQFMSLFLCFPPCLPYNLPLSLLGFSDGRPCQCVVCQCGNSREHRGPFTEAKEKTAVRGTPQCSLFLTAQHTTLHCAYVQYRNVHHTADTSRPLP